MEPKRKICPYCNGSALDMYGNTGGSCPHCFGGYLPDEGYQDDEPTEKDDQENTND